MIFAGGPFWWGGHPREPFLKIASRQFSAKVFRP
jgi:hypothetical protein